MVSSNKLRLLLRAEVEHRGAVKVTHTIEISEAGAVVRTDDPPPVGSSVRIRLSFPRLVSPLSLAGTVASHHRGERPGDPAAMTVRFEEEAQRREVARMLARVEHPTTPQPPAEDVPATYRVLLVEDNEMIRDMFAYGVRKYFAKLASRVAIDLAADGSQAWSMLEKGSYDLVIVDFYLPILDGSQLVTRMRKDVRLNELPVVGISIGGEDARTAMLKAGADFFLDKPVVLRDLLSTLERLAKSGERS